MHIRSIKPFSVHDLVAKLKQLTMLSDHNVKPYQNASIQVSDITTSMLAPAQLYVQRSEFEKVRDLRWVMLDKFGVDILRLADRRVRNGELVDLGMQGGDQLGYIEIMVAAKVDQEPQAVTVLPPIIEVWTEADKSKVNIINDGMHRCYLARICRVIPAVVRIENIPPHLPYYAYPTPDGWANVNMVDQIDSKLIKKHHRFPSYKKYYRNFNSVFINVGGPRGYDHNTVSK